MNASKTYSHVIQTTSIPRLKQTLMKFDLTSKLDFVGIFYTSI